MDFWNDNLTRASWEKLQELTKEIDFVLIGGWAIYLWTKQHKSKDIDIVVDYENLQKLKQKYHLEKNERLRKYEIKFEEFDIDIYLPHYSRLSAPVESILKKTKRIEGIVTVEPEVLLILKQGAELQRRNSVKGIKDSIDTLTLLIYAPIDRKNYERQLKEYGLENYSKELKNIVKNFKTEDLKYLGLNFQEFNRWKKEFLKL